MSAFPDPTSPSSFADPSQNDPGQPGWTLDGQGIVNVLILQDDISGPVLAAQQAGWSKPSAYSPSSPGSAA